MSKLTDFLAGNVVDNLTAEVAVSKRIPGKFKIKVLGNQEREELSQRATIKGVYSETKFAKLVILNCVLEPALNDATLMEKVGANTPEDVIEKCLLAGEQEELFKEIVKLSGFDKNINESIETAKN